MLTKVLYSGRPLKSICSQKILITYSCHQVGKFICFMRVRLYSTIVPKKKIGLNKVKFCDFMHSIIDNILDS